MPSADQEIGNVTLGRIRSLRRQAATAICATASSDVPLQREILSTALTAPVAGFKIAGGVGAGSIVTQFLIDDADSLKNLSDIQTRQRPQASKGACGGKRPGGLLRVFSPDKLP